MASETSTCNGFFTDHGNSALNNYFQQLSSSSGGSTASSGSSAVGGSSSGGGSSGGGGNVSGSDGSNNDNSQTNSSGSSTSSVGSTNSRVHSSNSASSGGTPSNQWNEIQQNQQQQQQQQQQQHQQQQQQHQQQLPQHQHQQQQQQQQHPQSHSSATSASHHHPHHPHLSAISHTLTQNLPVASNTHSIFGTGNFHYKTNNSWTIPSLSCYQRIYNETHYQRSFHPTDASGNAHGNSGSSTAGNDNLLSNHHHHHHHQQPHHHHHHHHGGGAGGGGGGGATTNVKRFQPAPTSGKSGNSKEICGDDKFKEDGDPWNVEAQAAFLGPNLWDKTLPYDADLKVTQYADLDEFLSENNIPDGLPGTHLGHTTGLGHRSDSLGHSAGLSLGLGHITTKRERSPSPSDCISPDTLNPPSPAESTFSFASSGRDFDPRTRAFSDEELKPQPMIKKSRKQFVPDELKDDKYWARRRKNNIAAKRSRDARRQKENQIAMRARYLEKENATLHQEVEQLKQENMDLRARLSKFQDV